MNPDKQRLMHDLLNDDARIARRAETLLAGTRVLRRRRQIRQVKWTLGVLSVATLATFWFLRPIAPQTDLAVAPVKNSAPVATAQIPNLSDEELLAMFPDVPVGLVTLSNGRKKLIFPRAEDEARFMRHF